LTSSPCSHSNNADDVTATAPAPAVSSVIMSPTAAALHQSPLYHSSPITCRQVPTPATSAPTSGRYHGYVGGVGDGSLPLLSTFKRDAVTERGGSSGDVAVIGTGRIAGGDLSRNRLNSNGGSMTSDGSYTSLPRNSVRDDVELTTILLPKTSPSPSSMSSSTSKCALCAATAAGSSSCGAGLQCPRRGAGSAAASAAQRRLTKTERVADV
jgi:hypothetical protein